MATNSAAKAIPELEKALEQEPEDLLLIKTKWYRALAYLQTGDIKKSGELLNALVKDKGAGEYKSKAENLLAELKKK